MYQKITTYCFIYSFAIAALTSVSMGMQPNDEKKPYHSQEAIPDLPEKYRMLILRTLVLLQTTPDLVNDKSILDEYSNLKKLKETFCNKKFKLKLDLSITTKNVLNRYTVEDLLGFLSAFNNSITSSLKEVSLFHMIPRDLLFASFIYTSLDKANRERNLIESLLDQKKKPLLPSRIITLIIEFRHGYYTNVEICTDFKSIFNESKKKLQSNINPSNKEEVSNAEFLRRIGEQTTQNEYSNYRNYFLYFIQPRRSHPGYWDRLPETSAKHRIYSFLYPLIVAAGVGIIPLVALAILKKAGILAFTREALRYCILPFLGLISGYIFCASPYPIKYEYIEKEYTERAPQPEVILEIDPIKKNL